MTRLEKWAKRVTAACEEARRHSRWGDEHAAAQAVLEREVRAFAKQMRVGIDDETSIDAWLDSPCPTCKSPYIQPTPERSTTGEACQTCGDGLPCHAAKLPSTVKEPGNQKGLDPASLAAARIAIREGIRDGIQDAWFERPVETDRTRDENNAINATRVTTWKVEIPPEEPGEPGR